MKLIFATLVAVLFASTAQANVCDDELPKVQAGVPLKLTLSLRSLTAIANDREIVVPMRIVPGTVSGPTGYGSDYDTYRCNFHLSPDAELEVNGHTFRIDSNLHYYNLLVRISSGAIVQKAFAGSVEAVLVTYDQNAKLILSEAGIAPDGLVSDVGAKLFGLRGPSAGSANIYLSPLPATHSPSTSLGIVTLLTGGDEQFDLLVKSITVQAPGE